MGSTKTTTDYIYVNDRPKAKIIGGGSSPGTYFHVLDAPDSTRQVWQQGKTSATFSPFGMPVSLSGSEKVEYAGEPIDSATGASPGLYYIGARWMDSDPGRWLSLDPQLGKLSSSQSLNRYVYCVNNPDPLAISKFTNEGVRHLRDRALHIRRNVGHEDRSPLKMDSTS